MENLEINLPKNVNPVKLEAFCKEMLLSIEEQWAACEKDKKLLNKDILASLLHLICTGMTGEYDAEHKKAFNAILNHVTKMSQTYVEIK